MAYDLAYYDYNISERTIRILEMKSTIAGYNTTIQKCKDEKEGLFSVYSCKRNTGKTIDDWRDARTLAAKSLARLEEDLAFLKKERQNAAKAIEVNLGLRDVEADVEIRESIASGEAAKKYGLWIGVAAIALTFGFLAFKKIRS